MRTPAFLLACLLPLTACSVDRYTLRGRVFCDPQAGAQSMRSGKADALTGRPASYAKVRLVMDPDNSLHCKELGAFSCDADGRFEVRDLQAPGVELVPYVLRVEAYAPQCLPLHLNTSLPSPGHTLVLRMAPAQEGTPARTLQNTVKSSDSYLRDTLKESQPYLNGAR